MLLDYERYQRKSSKKKLRLIFLLALLVFLAVGAYFLITRLVSGDPIVSFAAAPTPQDNLEKLWSQLVSLEQTVPDPDDREDQKKRLLDEILSRGEESLQADPLSGRLLLFHGYGSFYRALYEASFESQLPFFNRSLVSLRRALTTTGEKIKPQLYYMLGRIYFFKRNYYYDLAQRYLEKALNLGYKKVEALEYLVLIYNDWGQPDKSIACLERAYEEKKSDVYLFYLAKSYKKVKRLEEAGGILKTIIDGSSEAGLVRESRFLFGEILFEQGKYDAAEKQYREILNQDKNSAEAHFRLALIYERLGDYARYRFELRSTLGIDGGHNGARSRLR